MTKETVKIWVLIEKAYDMQQCPTVETLEDLKIWNHSSTGVIFALYAMDAIEFNLYKAVCADLDLINKCRSEDLIKKE